MSNSNSHCTKSTETNTTLANQLQKQPPKFSYKLFTFLCAFIVGAGSTACQEGMTYSWDIIHNGIICVIYITPLFNKPMNKDKDK